MRREARPPQKDCGPSYGSIWRQLVAGCFAVCFAALAGLTSARAQTQDPNIAATSPNVLSTPQPPKAFGGGKGSEIFGNINRPIDKTQPMNVQGDQLVYDTAGNKVIARGNVEIFYNDYILTADEVVYDQSAKTLTAAGNVVLKEPQGNVVRADRYTLTDDFRDGFVQSLSIVTKDQSTISADQATRRDANVTEFRNGRFTPCKSTGSTPPLWCLSAATIVHDKDAATITYQDAFFEVFGQPVLYLPYFQHPDPSVKRKSGFLTPEIGNSSNLGFITGIPYYYTIDPSTDFTFDPLYLSKQGILWKGEFRQRLANGQYTIELAGIDQDANDLPDAVGRELLEGFRGSLVTRGQFALSSWWKAGWDVTVESDDQFRRFYKLDDILVTDRVNEIYLTGLSGRNYFSAKLYQFGGLLLNDNNQSESYTHPIIDYNYIFEDPVLGGELKLDTNFLSFTRVDGAGNGTRNQNINRLTTEVKWRRRLTDQIGITYTPFANLRGDVYQFDNFTDAESVVLNPDGTVASSQLISSDTTVRGIASGGVTVAYPWVANTASASHILEPIGQVISSQQDLSQRQLPDEDARSLVFDDTNLFELSRFSGYDRTEIGTRVNAGLQYTFQANDGGYVRLLAGESYHLTGDNVYANPGRDDAGTFIYSPASGLETNRSDVVLGAYVAPTESFRLISQSRFDQSTLALRREDLAAQVIYGPFIGTTTYAFTAASPEANVPGAQEEIYSTALVQLTDNWSFGAGLRYDLDQSRVLQDSFQLRYADECFALTATYSDLYYNNATIDNDQTILFRFELKHIGEYKYKTDTTNFGFGGEQRTN